MYRLGTIGSGTLQDDLKKAWASIRGKENPFLKVGETNQRNQKGGEYVMALKDINFEVKPGEVLGIIGKNGAGKSTLLKLLSKVTKPSTGSIKTRGRIASLLEVGTGFHPELTGKENIFLNGAILGMKKSEIKDKFDDIVAFSGCERYIDTPVKRYSSGMYVRLAFAVAAHLEPEILVVDEVLAVGDVEFQKKAIGKMKDIAEGQGRTVLFVSHVMSSIQELCSNVLVMKNGSVDFIGETSEGIERYLERDRQDQSSEMRALQRAENLGTKALFTGLAVINSKNEPCQQINFYENYSIQVQIDRLSDTKNVRLNIGISDGKYERLSTFQTEDFELLEGENSKTLYLENYNLTPGKYYITLGLVENGTPIDHLEFIGMYEITDFKQEESTNKLSHLGKVAHQDYKWK